MMASTPAIVTNTARRAAERGEGGAGGPGTISSVIDRANNRSQGSNSSWMAAYWNNIVANFLPARGYICVMVTGLVLAGCQGKVLLNDGGQDDAAAHRRSTEVGLGGTARLERCRRARGDRQDLRVQGFQRSLR